MKMPEWIKPAVWGGVVGAIALAIVGFSAGWVVWNGTAQKMADASAEKAVLAVMTPICIAQFERASQSAKPSEPDTAATGSRGVLLAALMKEDSWKRGAFVSERGWATMPGSEKANSDVAGACATELSKLAAATDKK